jgi:hypothetical protein
MRRGFLRRRVGLTRVRVGAVVRARTIFSQALRPLSLLYGHIITLKAICTLIRLAKAFVLRRGSFTLVVHQPTRTPANKHETFSDKIRHFAGISERQRTTTTLWICLHTAEVAGSSPASLTKKYLQIAWYQDPLLPPRGSSVQQPVPVACLKTQAARVSSRCILSEGCVDRLLRRRTSSQRSHHRHRAKA